MRESEARTLPATRQRTTRPEHKESRQTLQSTPKRRLTSLLALALVCAGSAAVMLN